MVQSPLWWRKSSCGYVHRYGVCDNDHPWTDARLRSNEASIGDTRAYVVDALIADVSAGTVTEIVKKLRKHRLATYLSAGMVSCECGNISALSWFTEHVIDEVTKA